MNHHPSECGNTNVWMQTPILSGLRLGKVFRDLKRKKKTHNLKEKKWASETHIYLRLFQWKALLQWEDIIFSKDIWLAAFCVCVFRACPGTRSTDQAVLELTEIRLSVPAFQALQLRCVPLLSSLILLLFFKCVCMLAYVCTPMCLCTSIYTEASRGMGSLELTNTSRCLWGAWYGCWDPSSGL